MSVFSLSFYCIVFYCIVLYCYIRVTSDAEGRLRGFRRAAVVWITSAGLLGSVVQATRDVLVAMWPSFSKQLVTVVRGPFLPNLYSIRNTLEL